MACAALANGRKLCRVVVPRNSLYQTAQLLHLRLGGLLGRELRHLPFNRRTASNEDDIETYAEIHSYLLQSSGILISRPDSILSFKLSGLQRLADNENRMAEKMIHMQKWLNRNCRDILDESDYQLSVRTQLIYSSGAQETIDGNPNRWEIIEELLHAVEINVEELQTDYPDSIDVVRRDGIGFPFISMVRDDVEEALVKRLISASCEGQSSIFPSILQWSEDERQILKQFLCDKAPPEHVVSYITQDASQHRAFDTVCYSLRGLLHHRILPLCLKKRYNVQYGLHPERDPLAVPYTAKGLPSDYAEWGHPDVALTLTCLSFYYTGLTHSQALQCLRKLLNSDDPTPRYESWCQSAQVPEHLRDWTLINLEDKTQVQKLHQHLRFSIIVINYYLNNFVFPAHARQFPIKSQTSGWDIPLFDPLLSPSETSSAITTGFSGTNDNKAMLPLNIRQRDLKQLSHTNAEVLIHLLKERNNRFEVLTNEQTGRRLADEQFLQLLGQRGIYVLIDAGVCIQELTNEELASIWLSSIPTAQAAVYFDGNDRAWVQQHDKQKIPLLASPYATNLEGCLVYYDQAHVRGTDLKLPIKARGALTLGLRQTKDHTVQAAMRLRQLATSQSVTFFAGPDVEKSIRHLCQKKSARIDSSDVVHWLLEQTCQEMGAMMPLYLAQAHDYCLRMQASIDNPKFLTKNSARSSYLDVVQVPEQQDLQHLYAPKSTTTSFVFPENMAPSLQRFATEVSTRRRQHISTVSADVPLSVFEEVEQEREVSLEVENIKETQGPKVYKPLEFPGLNRYLNIFAMTGNLAAGVFPSAFDLLSDKNPALKYGFFPSSMMSKLLLSTEFGRTVDLRVDHSADFMVCRLFQTTPELINNYANRYHSDPLHGYCTTHRQMSALFWSLKKPKSF